MLAIVFIDNLYQTEVFIIIRHMCWILSNASPHLLRSYNVFLLYFVNKMNYVNWFLNVKPTLSFWEKILHHVYLFISGFDYLIFCYLFYVYVFLFLFSYYIPFCFYELGGLCSSENKLGNDPLPLFSEKKFVTVLKIIFLKCLI